MRGDLELSSQMVVGIVIAIITVFLLYVVFPRSACDAEAQLSAAEIKKAVECAAGTGPLGCSKTATIKLCQEDAWSLTGFGWVQNYFGLMVPEYMIYYQKFPTIPVEETRLGSLLGGGGLPFLAKWSDSFPFERASTGQRWWDLRPTFTQFKQFYKTKYLQQGCTSDTGMCVNVRGREDVLKINLPDDVKDVKIFRPPTLVSDPNPKFHLVAPCYARVSFEKVGEEVLASVNKGSTDASNYCYADAGLINGELDILKAEGGCRAVDLALTVLSFGSKKAVQEGIKQASKKVLSPAVKKKIMQEAWKETEQQVGKLGGKIGSRGFERLAVETGVRKAAKEAGETLTEAEIASIVEKSTTKTGAKFWGSVLGQAAKKKAPGYEGFNVGSFIDIPCLDLGDLCRGGFSCAEATLMWPGWPFKELTPEKMTEWKNTVSLSEILGNCCENMLYGYEQDFSKIECDQPEHLVGFIKQDLGVESNTSLSLKNVTNALHMTETKAGEACNNFYSDRSQSCSRADEVRATGASYYCGGTDSHTYSMRNPLTPNVMLAFVRLDEGNSDEEEPNCRTTIAVSTHNGTAWKEIFSTNEAKPYPEMNAISVKLPTAESITKLKIEDKEKKCHLDYSEIIIDPIDEDITQAAGGEVYDLNVANYRFFIVPEGFQSSASELCRKINSCTAVQKILPDRAIVRFLKDLGRDDFSITGGDTIGIQAYAAGAKVSFAVPATT